MKGIQPRCSITGAAALAILNAVDERARAEGISVFVAVVDGTGELVGLLAQDNVPSLCRRIAQDKAYTAYATKMKTAAWKAYVFGAPEEERHLMLNQDRFIAAAGGCPILVDGMVAGAVGVSGGGQAEDEMLAELGAALALTL